MSDNQDTMKILIVGNGWNAHFNNKLKDFNNNFLIWLENYASSVDEFDSFFDTVFNNFEDFKEKIFVIIKYFYKELIKYKENLTENFTIESAIKLIGENYSRNVIKNKGDFNQENKNKDLFFSICKTLLGYYIEFSSKFDDQIAMWFENGIENYQFESGSFENLVNLGYDLIFTTNYNEILKNFIYKWRRNSIYYDHFELRVINIHGKNEINAENFIQRYSNIQINLEDKKISTQLSFLKIPFENYWYNHSNNPSLKNLNIEIDLYGLSMNNDNHLIHSICKDIALQFSSKFRILELGNIELIINYFYFKQNEMPNINYKIKKIVIKEINSSDVRNHELYKITDEIIKKIKLDIEKNST
ncbi:hypothetical protein [Spiroplasma floricola]|uniref:Uncharacterized protein n=1 Tax=Spiroplasma floricola 23-6 TaxID=1336749 RepID=A0A2K8SE89_9MOLU|nr:hypothetical protein [Spiroplasma floricola]AUB31771.1 hypothetical protein SFLOR_v1c07230 [Spiroplasma floricola 23-6]